MEKGVTPVIAATVMVGLVVVGGTTVYLVTSDVIENSKTSPEDRVNKFELVSCHRDSLETNMVFRNSNDRFLNLSRADLRINNRRIENLTFSNSTVGPYETFTAKIGAGTARVDNSDEVEVFYGGADFKYRCTFVKGISFDDYFSEGGDSMQRLVLMGNMTGRTPNLCIGDSCGTSTGNSPTDVFDTGNDYLNRRGDNINGSISTDEFVIRGSSCIGDGCVISSGTASGFVTPENNTIEGSIRLDALKTDSLCAGSSC